MQSHSRESHSLGEDKFKKATSEGLEEKASNVKQNFSVCGRSGLRLIVLHSYSGLCVLAGFL
jgi:hypothetical protein